MNHLRPIFSGLLAALISGFILIGGLSASLAEGTQPFQANPPTETAVATQNLEDFVTVVPRSTSTLVLAATETLSRVKTATSQPLQPYCPPPEGWVSHTIQADETLESLAESYHTTIASLSVGNCLVTDTLLPGTTLNVPDVVQATPEPTSTVFSRPAACGPPAGWVTYTVKHADTLYQLAQTFNTTVADLQRANCMGASDRIVTNDRLYVPFVPTPEPPTSTPTSSPTASATATESAATPATTTPPTEAETSEPAQTVEPSPAATPTIEPTTSSTEPG